jgi:hypothetical protein
MAKLLKARSGPVISLDKASWFKLTVAWLLP